MAYRIKIRDNNKIGRNIRIEAKMNIRQFIRLKYLE